MDKKANIYTCLLYSYVFVIITTIISIFVFNGTAKNILFILAIVEISLFLVYSVINEAYVRKVSKEIYSYLDNCISENNYVAGIKYLEERIKKYRVPTLFYICGINLVMLYLLIDDKDNAGYYLYNCNYRIMTIQIMYYKILFEIYDDHLQEARKLFKKFMRMGNKKYDLQRSNLILLFDVIETREMNYELYNSTNFQIVKDICNKFVKY